MSNSLASPAPPDRARPAAPPIAGTHVGSLQWFWAPHTRGPFLLLHFRPGNTPVASHPSDA
eukprot:4754101-Prymnesium_polylepis.1